MNKKQKTLRKQHLKNLKRFRELLTNKHFIRKNIQELIEFENKSFLCKFNDSKN